MNIKPLVSVVVITYNQEKVLPKTLDCILKQECNFPFEVIVGDDASVDGTKKVLEAYAKRYEGIVRPVFQDANKGILGNFISTISKSQGKYLAFCDGDDYWIDVSKLAKQVDILEHHPEFGLIYSDVLMDSKVTGEQYRRTMQNPQNDLFTQLLKGNIIVSSTVCMRADLLHYVDFDMYVKQNFKMEDYPLWLSLSLHTRFYYLKEVTTAYVIERKVVTSDEVCVHACKFDENTTKIRLYFRNKYPERTTLTEAEILDAHYKICYLAGLNMNDRKYTLKYASMMHDRNKYVRRLTFISKSRVLFSIYQWYRKLSGKTRTPLQMYFGM